MKKKDWGKLKLQRITLAQLDGIRMGEPSTTSGSNPTMCGRQCTGTTDTLFVPSQCETEYLSCIQSNCNGGPSQLDCTGDCPLFTEACNEPPMNPY